MHWETSDGRYKIRAVNLDGIEYLRAEWFPGRYYKGDYRTLDELRRALPDVDLADLVQVED